MEFGEKLKQLRKANHLSQEKLSEHIHVSRQAIPEWEQGSAMPDTDNVALPSRFSQVPIEYLLLNDKEMREAYQYKSLVTEESVLPKARIISLTIESAVGIVVVVVAYLL